MVPVGANARVDDAESARAHVSMVPSRRERTFGLGYGLRMIRATPRKTCVRADSAAGKRAFAPTRPPGSVCASPPEEASADSRKCVRADSAAGKRAFAPTRPPGSVRSRRLDDRQPSAGPADRRQRRPGHPDQVGGGEAEVEAAPAARDVDRPRSRSPTRPARWGAAASGRRARSRRRRSRWPARPSAGSAIVALLPPTAAASALRSSFPETGTIATTSRPSTDAEQRLEHAAGSSPSTLAASSPYDAAAGSCA